MNAKRSHMPLSACAVLNQGSASLAMLMSLVVGFHSRQCPIESRVVGITHVMQMERLPFE